TRTGATTMFFGRPQMMSWWWRKKALSDAQSWGLAAGGPLTVASGWSFTELRLRWAKRACREGLREAYEISYLDGLQATFRWLLHEGHRSPCLEVCELLRQSPEFPDLAPEAPDLHRFVAEYINQLEKFQLVGFDLSRLVILARCGYTVEYIGEQEAWSWVLEAARRIQRAFPCWEELGRDFLLGHRFLELSGGNHVTEKNFAAHHWLLNNPISPWRRLPWDTPLGPVEESTEGWET